MNKLFFCFFLAISWSKTYSQDNEPIITFGLYKKAMKDSSDCDFFVQYDNKGDKPVRVYKELINGSIDAPISNITLQVEQMVDGQYKKRQLGIVHPWLVNEDSMFEANLEYLGSQKTKLLRINLLNYYEYLYKGKYRVKAFLVKIPHNESGSNGMKFIESGYIYFEVRKWLTKRYK